MKKHQFVKADCNCLRRATYFTCKYCGTVEYCSLQEIKTLNLYRATCKSDKAPDASHAEEFKSKFGGTIDCLAPDFETWEKDQKAKGNVGS